MAHIIVFEQEDPEERNSRIITYDPEKKKFGFMLGGDTKPMTTYNPELENDLRMLANSFGKTHSGKDLLYPHEIWELKKKLEEFAKNPQLEEIIRLTPRTTIVDSDEAQTC
jgi:hypothetical protein